MPKTQILLFKDKDGKIPALQWLEKMKKTEPKRYAKCLASLLSLSVHGFELKRPAMDLLQAGIYELRPVREKKASVHYRILFFFMGQNMVVISHGFSKKASRVPQKEIDLAISRKRMIESDSEAHIAEWNL